MPFSDRPPAMVFPDTEIGRAKRARFVAEEFDVLNKSVLLCSEFRDEGSPIYTDDDFYRERDIPICSRRKRDGVRDMNWCCRCFAGFPNVWLDARDVDRFRDGTTL